jgi:hypothetical protein
MPVTGGGGPWGCERLRLPHFLDNQLKDGGEAVGLYSSGRFLELICYRPSRPQGHSAVEWIGLTEKSNDLIGNGSRDLPA